MSCSYFLVIVFSSIVLEVFEVILLFLLCIFKCTSETLVEYFLVDLGLPHSMNLLNFLCILSCTIQKMNHMPQRQTIQDIFFKSRRGREGVVSCESVLKELDITIMINRKSQPTKGSIRKKIVIDLTFVAGQYIISYFFFTITSNCV